MNESLLKIFLYYCKKQQRGRKREKSLMKREKMFIKYIRDGVKNGKKQAYKCLTFATMPWRELTAKIAPETLTDSQFGCRSVRSADDNDNDNDETHETRPALLHLSLLLPRSLPEICVDLQCKTTEMPRLKSLTKEINLGKLSSFCSSPVSGELHALLDVSWRQKLCPV